MRCCQTVLICLLWAAPAVARAGSSACGRFDGPALEGALEKVAPGLSPKVLHLALGAFERAACAGRARRTTLAVIDYSRPSQERRLWVFDLEKPSLLFHEWVAHGRGSGAELAERFSNNAGSLMSSVGVFVTAETYRGRHGLSLVLDGLEPGINDLARTRAVVIHGAEYVSDEFGRAHGRMGRSWGCPAVSTQIAHRLIGALQEGAVVFAWFPDPDWLARSQFLR